MFTLGQVGSQIKGGTKKSTGIMPTSGDSSTAADPVVFAAAFKRNRFYVFSRREPDEGAVHALRPAHARPCALAWLRVGMAARRCGWLGSWLAV